MDRLPLEIVAMILGLCTDDGRRLARWRRVSKPFRRAVASVESVRIAGLCTIVDLVRPSTTATYRRFQSIRCFRECQRIELDLSSLDFDDDGMWNALLSCSHLKHFAVRFASGGVRAHRLPRFLQRLEPTLRSVHVHCSNLAVLDIPAISGVSSLTSLSWCWPSALTGYCDWLTGLHSLLDLTVQPVYPTEYIRDVLAPLTTLTRLSLTAYNRTSDDVALPVPTTLTALRVLECGAAVLDYPFRQWPLTLRALTAIEALALRPSSDFMCAGPPPRLRSCTLLFAWSFSDSDVVFDEFAHWCDRATLLQDLTIQHPPDWMMVESARLPALRSLTLDQPPQAYHGNFWLAVAPVLQHPRCARVSISALAITNSPNTRFEVPASFPAPLLDRPVAIEGHTSLRQFEAWRRRHLHLA